MKSRTSRTTPNPHYNRDKGALASLSFGDSESGYIKKDDCKGSSFGVGAAVEYRGKQCKVSKAVDRDGELNLKVKFPAATLETSMTEADISGLELGAAGAIIAAAFLPKW